MFNSSKIWCAWSLTWYKKSSIVGSLLEITILQGDLPVDFVKKVCNSTGKSFVDDKHLWF